MRFPTKFIVVKDDTELMQRTDDYRIATGPGNDYDDDDDDNDVLTGSDFDYSPDEITKQMGLSTF